MADWLAQFDDEVSTMLGGKPYRPAEAKSYAPTLRDRIAGYLMGDERASTYKARFVEGLLGSRGMGTTGVGLADVTPLGIPMGLQDAIRAGDPNAVALAIMPGGGVANKAGQKVAKEAAGEVKQGIRAYHGSPHDFDRFDMSKIGTGEGAQVYGHGLYFADSPEVARTYRDQLGDYSNVVTWKGAQPPTAAQQRIINQLSGFDVVRNRAPDLASVRTDITRQINRERMSEGMPGWDAERSARRVAQLQDELATLDGMKGLIETRAPGRLYEVNIKANPDDFLDWDKPLSQQSEKVRKALDKLWGGFLDETAFGRRYAPTSKETAQKSGIPGIKYLDQGSRAAGEGSRNYVVFDDKLIDIVKKYGIAAVATALGMSQAEFKAQFEGSQQK